MLRFARNDVSKHKKMNTKYIAYIAIIVFSFNCKGNKIDPVEPTDIELQLASLQNDNKPWSITSGSVTKDGYDVSSQFNGFVLTVGEFTYSTQNGLNSAWPSAGTWEFSNNDPNKIMRDDGVLMNVEFVDNNLILTFSATNVGGRVKGIDGEYEFILSGE